MGCYCQGMAQQHDHAAGGQMGMKCERAKGMSGGCACCSKQKAASDNAAAKERCPLRSMKVDAAKAPKLEYKGKTYYFCCKHRLETFKADPEKFLAKNGSKS